MKAIPGVKAVVAGLGTRPVAAPRRQIPLTSDASAYAHCMARKEE
jgi:hypothetical protein